MSKQDIAWRPLSLLAGGAGLLMLMLSVRYGFHRDELYYLAAGDHLAWGYDDQPPMVALIAKAATELAGGHIMVLRLPATLAVVAVLLLTGLITAELGGGRGAQILAALVFACSPIVVISGHLLSTTILDIFWWTLLAYLLVRWLKSRDSRWLYAAGPVIGLALLTKTLVLLFLAGLLAGIAIAGPRDIFRRPALWITSAAALLLWAPNLYWQATHGWPQLAMTGVIAEDADWGGRIGLIPVQAGLIGAPLAAIWIAGLWRLLRNNTPEVRPFRLFGIAYLTVLLLTLLTGGREYYPAGAYPVLLASGAIATVAWLQTKPWHKWLLVAGFALSVPVTVVMGLPLFPMNSLADSPQPAINYDAGEQVGWPALAHNVANVFRSLPADEQRTAVIVTGNYGQAGALYRYGPPLGLPRPYSGHLGFWRWGPPPEVDGPVIIVGGYRADELGRYCTTVDLAARHDNGLRVDNEEQGVPIWLCRGRKLPWAQLWPELRHQG